MIQGRSTCLLCFCLVICFFINVVESQDGFKMSQPNTEGWINPDVAFAPSRTPKSARISEVSGEDPAECHKNLNQWVEKYSECERALHTREIDKKSEEKDKNKEIAVSKPSDAHSSQCSQEKNGAKAYLQRFVRLLLEVSNLNNIDVQSENWAKLKFSISSDQLHTLQKFAREGDVKSVPLRKLDEILGTILVKPYFSLPEFSVGDIVDKLPHFHIGSFFVSALLPILWFLSVLFVTRNITKSFVWLIPVAFLTSFLTAASQMFEEAQMKQYEEMKRYPDMPRECNGGSGLVGFLFAKSTACSKFLKAHHMDPNLGITFFKVLTKMFGETMADAMQHFGTGTFGFIQTFEEMGFINRLWAVPLALAVLYAFAVLLLLVVTGGTVRLPLFMGSFSFHNTARVQPDLQRYSDAHAATGPQRTESLPPSGNITVNINSQVPHNVHELLASLSQGVLASNQPNHATPSTAALQSLLAGGDVVFNNATNQSHLHRLQSNLGSKKTHKQFSQLNSKYKSGAKSSNKLSIKRVRNLSL